MPTIDFPVGDLTRNGYLALPPTGKGPGVLVCHAWWGLNQDLRDLCDRLAQNGYVAFAPDLHLGKIATTIEQAEQIMETRDFPAIQTTAENAVKFFRAHPAVQGDKLGAIGFSMGANFVLILDETFPDSFAAIVLFYGGCGADVSASHARYIAHFAEGDTWEPMEEVNKMTASNLQIFIYPNTGHWFFEPGRPDAYQPESAALAWERTLNFLRETLQP